MPVKKRKCKNCGEFVEDFIIINAGVFCSVNSAYLFVTAKQKQQRKRNHAKVKALQVKAGKVAKKAHREAKERIKPLSKWLAELQALVNKYVRLRDINDGCISCEKPFNWHGQWHAGHYFSRGSSSSLRFNLWNLHKQCSVCNNHLSGNIGEYTPRIINKISQDKFDFLSANKSKVARYDVDWIKRAIKVTRKAIKRLEKRQLL
jgi:hypothetical protein